MKSSTAGLCSTAQLLEFHEQCVRRFWEACITTTLVLIWIVFSLPKTRRVATLLNQLKGPFTPFITLKEAQALQLGEPKQEPAHVPLWHTLLFSWVALGEVIAWLAVGTYGLTLDNGKNFRNWQLWTPFLIAFSWLYGSIRPLIRPQLTPPFDLLALYLVHCASSAAEISASIYNRHFGIHFNQIEMTMNILSFIANVTLICVVLAMPLSIPSVHIDCTKIGTEITPEDYTSLWGWLTFSWVNPLLKRGIHSTLNEEDVWNLSPLAQSRPIFTKFVDIRRPSLTSRIWAANSLDIIFDTILTLVSVTLNYASPFFLNHILRAINDPSPDGKYQGYIYCLLAFLCSILKAEADSQHLWCGRRAATRARSALMASVFYKALKRKDSSGIVHSSGRTSNTEKKKGGKASDLGKIVQLMSSDTSCTSQLMTSGYCIWGAPFEIAIASTFLYLLLGLSAFAGLSVLVIAIPINHFLSKRNMTINKALSNVRDKRMSILNELILEAKFMKILSWEGKWTKRTLDCRSEELKLLVKERTNSLLFNFLWVSVPVLVSIVSFWMFVMQGNVLTVPIAFTAIALFNMLKQPLNTLPNFIVSILQARVAIRRIEDFLNEEEVPEYVTSLTRENCTIPTNQFLGIERGSFQWNSMSSTPDADPSPAKPDSFPTSDSHNRFELHNISVLFPVGQFTVITGPTGSGKTALLMALLGEMTSTRTDCIVHLPKNVTQVDEQGMKNSLSYAAQRPWLEHLSIKDNILFGSPYEENRYQEVLECCALIPDLAILEDGDLTEIGARGISLSGGQKARVALARAVYCRTKHVLLDDPLSAVDSHTARFICERLLQGPLMKNRTVVVVLATHHVELILPAAYYVVRMLDGRIDTQGTVQELRADGLLDTIPSSSQQEFTSVLPFNVTESFNFTDNDLTTVKKPRKFVEEETRKAGGVKWSVYKVYLEAFSYLAWFCILMGILLFSGIGILEKIWIQIWGDSYNTLESGILQGSYMLSSASLETFQDNFQAVFRSLFLDHEKSYPKVTTLPALPDARFHPLFYVAIYASLGLGAALTTTMTSIIQYQGALRASKALFQRLLHSVVQSTMRWHDTTPTGRILNRFSKDIATIDSSLSGSIRLSNARVANFIAALLTIAVAYPGFLIPGAVIGYVYVKLSIGYVNTGRDLRRMESTTRSPIFTGFGETLDGIVTVRAFAAERRFLDNLHTKIDTTTKMWYNYWMLNRWLLLRFDTLGALSVLITSLLALSGLIPSMLAGLTITSAMSFTTAVYWTCRQVTSLEIDLNSVERVVEYLDLPQEPPAIVPSNRPPAYWPSNTSNPFISVENLVIQYAPELQPVLHGISFSINAREKVGLLGRTGSGKSTLAMAFLRFVEPAQGSITLDGINISSIGLHDLRSRVTIIPQDSVLFTGTIRDNLDPLGEYSDEDCLNALYRVQLLSESAPSSSSLSSETWREASYLSVETNLGALVGLYTKVSFGGSNFSQGQRQLLAMARALLRKSSFAIFDEATSSIDFETDAKIQVIIREEFKDSCILTVAHRIRTVIDYDRLIILDNGRIVELDTPYSLIQKEGGVFRDMCLKSGTFHELEEAARVASTNNNGL